MNLEGRIAKTLTLFALQSTALTLLELWKFLVRDAADLESSLSKYGELVEVPVLENRTVSISIVAQELELLIKSGKVVERFGYCTISAYEELLEKRWRGYEYGVWREKRIRTFVRGVAYIPFVRGIALAGSQALGLEREESDIDLLVVTARSWLWLPRTLITGYFQLLGMRRHGRFVANRVCLNHYVVGPKSMQQGRNWYTATEYGKLRPLYGIASISLFQKANEPWVSAFFPNFVVKEKMAAKQSTVQKALEACLSLFGGKQLENILGGWQSKRIHKNEPHILVAQDELSFHPQSKQDGLLEAFR